MDLRQLRYFVTVAQTRNITRASELLHISQPPLSRQIQLLEEELGVTLLLRNSRPLRLTDAGRLFYEQATQILLRVEQMKNATRKVALNQRQSLSIGFVASTLYGGLPNLVRKLRQRFTDLDIQLLELTSMQQIEALKNGKIDIGFGRIRSNNLAVERFILHEERLVVAMAPNSPLAHTSEPISIQELVNQTLLLYPKEPRPSFADQILGLLNDYGVRLESTHEVRELQSALGLVAAEAGICLIPASAKLRADIHYRLIKEERITSPIILSYRINDSSWYIDIIKELGKELYAEHAQY